MAQPEPAEPLPGPAPTDPVPGPAPTRPAPGPAPTGPAGGTGLNPIFGLAAVVIVVAGLQAFGGVLGPLFLAVVLVVTVYPVAAAMSRRGLPRWLGALVTLVLVYAILLALVVALSYAITGFVRVLPGYATQFTALVTDAVTRLEALGIGRQEIQDTLVRIGPGGVVGFLQGLLGQVGGLLTNLVLVLTVLLFMAFDTTSLPERMGALTRSSPAAVAAMGSFARGTRRFLLVSTVFGLIIAVLDVGVLLLLGLPLAVLFGVLALFSNYIPSVGFLIAMVPPALLALLQGGLGLMLAVVGAFSVINVLMQTVLQPRFIGQAVGLSVTVTFLSLVFWGWVLGPLGALLAVPLTLLAKALLVDLDPRTRWLGTLLSDRPDPPVPAKSR